MLDIVKKIAGQTMNANAPARLEYGTVVQIAPMTVRIETGLDLKNPELISLGGAQYEAGTKVALLRDHGGQSYLLLGMV